MRSSIGKKLLFAFGLPAFAAALLGMGALWLRADRVAVQIAEPAHRAEVSALVRTALATVVVSGAVLLVAASASLYLIVGRRLRRLAELMQRAGAGEHLVRAEESGTDEIGRLGAAFNRMLAALTSLKAGEIEANMGLQEAREQLSLKARLEETNAKLASRIQELSTLYDVARSFTSTLELPEVLERISRLVAEHLEVPRFSIVLPRRDGKLEVRTTRPPDRSQVGLAFSKGEGACGLAAEKLRTIYLPDLESDGGIVRRRDGIPEIGSLLAVPMIHDGQLLGVLDFQRPERAAFSAEEIELLTAVADQAALAVKNARLHEQMRSLSLTDELTGAANRRSLLSRLDLEIARARRFGTEVSVLMIDVDHFKHLNDTAGHRAGDSVLRQMAERLRKMIRKVDTLARYGGEEFMVLLPQTSRSQALTVGEKLRRAVEEMDLPEGKGQPGGKLTVSIGAASLPGDATTLELLADCADAALYASKRDGRNRTTLYQPGMERKPHRELRDPTGAASSEQA